MLDTVLLNQGLAKTSFKVFNEFFAQFDQNGDGKISKQECLRFTAKFLESYDP